MEVGNISSIQAENKREPKVKHRTVGNGCGAEWLFLKRITKGNVKTV